MREKIDRTSVEVFALRKGEIFEKTRTERISRARQLFYRFLRVEMGWALQDIGNLFGKNHSTISYGIESVEADMENYPGVKIAYGEIKRSMNFGDGGEKDLLSKFISKNQANITNKTKKKLAEIINEF